MTLFDSIACIMIKHNPLERHITFSKMRILSQSLEVMQRNSIPFSSCISAWYPLTYISLRLNRVLFPLGAQRAYVTSRFDSSAILVTKECVSAMPTTQSYMRGSAICGTFKFIKTWRTRVGYLLATKDSSVKDSSPFSDERCVGKGWLPPIATNVTSVKDVSEF